jgi:hypothetical protein
MDRQTEGPTDKQTVGQIDGRMDRQTLFITYHTEDKSKHDFLGGGVVLGHVRTQENIEDQGQNWETLEIGIRVPREQHRMAKRHGAVFTALHFLCKLRVSPINRVTRRLEEEIYQIFQRIAQKVTKSKKAKISTIKLNFKAQNISTIKPLLKP